MLVHDETEQMARNKRVGKLPEIGMQAQQGRAAHHSLEGTGGQHEAKDHDSPEEQVERDSGGASQIPAHRAERSIPERGGDHQSGEDEWDRKKESKRETAGGFR